MVLGSCLWVGLAALMRPWGCLFVRASGKQDLQNHRAFLTCEAGQVVLLFLCTCKVAGVSSWGTGDPSAWGWMASLSHGERMEDVLCWLVSSLCLSCVRAGLEQWHVECGDEMLSGADTTHAHRQLHGWQKWLVLPSALCHSSQSFGSFFQVV